ncbi:MAG TPA: hypothetical protein VHC22_03295 [Pirellulales bacterium]|nr:hypothetical protein [Pirellulales bacterium]
MLGAITSPLAIALLVLTQEPAQPFVVATDEGYRVTTRVTTPESERLCESYVTRDAIRKTPAWDRDKSDSPPVSPRKAVRLAEKMRKSVVKDDTREWEIPNMHLIFEGDHCVWCVTFRTEPHLPEAGLVSFDEVTVFVLMDGTVVKPKLKGPEEFLPERADEEQDKKSE